MIDGVTVTAWVTTAILVVAFAQHALAWWQPHPPLKWQWILDKGSGALDTSVAAAVYDIDLFNNDAATIAALQAQGRAVICYFSAGSYEPGRPDSGQFPAGLKGSGVDGWPGEYWLDIRPSGPYYSTLQTIMRGRLSLAKSKGCNGVEPDLMDAYSNSNGKGITAQDQLTYNKWLASAAHELDLAVGLKNDPEQVAELVQYFDYAINEECFQYSECDSMKPFIVANKPVFNCEYQGGTSHCAQARALGFDSIAKSLDLQAKPYASCDDGTNAGLTTPPGGNSGPAPTPQQQTPAPTPKQTAAPTPQQQTPAPTPKQTAAPTPGGPNPTSAAPKPTPKPLATTPPSTEEPTCVSGATEVTLEGGQRVRVDGLRVGDRVRTPQGYEAVELFLHRRVAVATPCVQLCRVADGACTTVSSSHLVWSDTAGDYVEARAVAASEAARVEAPCDGYVSFVVGSGAFLTADGVELSCYASPQSVALSHAALHGMYSVLRFLPVDDWSFIGDHVAV